MVCFRIDRNNTKMDASRASLAYLIHLYGLSLINSFLTRLPALVPVAFSRQDVVNVIDNVLGAPRQPYSYC